MKKCAMPYTLMGQWIESSADWLEALVDKAREGRQSKYPDYRGGHIAALLLTGLLKKALWYSVFSSQYSEKACLHAENCYLKTENLKFAELQ